jgi:fibrillarin-like pre-rRNA processing protein
MKFYKAIELGAKNPIKKSYSVLYLGASHGVTVQKLAKECKIVFAVDKSKTTTKKLLEVAKETDNIAPILADANDMDSYKDRISKIDFLFQDIAQKDQVQIFIKAVKAFKPKEAWLALKIKGIYSEKRNAEVISEARDLLNSEFKVSDLSLEPLVKDHHLFIIKS